MLDSERKNTQVFEELGKILQSIPLDKLTMECTPMTKKFAWRSPKEMGFKISGCFNIEEDGSHIQFQCSPPLPSADLLKTWNPKEYKKFLKKAKGNEDEALRILCEEEGYDDYCGLDYHPPHCFLGRWLRIDLNVGKEIFVDNCDPHRHELPIIIEGDIESWYKSELYFGVIEDIKPDSPTILSCNYLAPIADVYWYQKSAQAYKNSLVELVAFPEPKMEFFIPPAPKSLLWLPETMADNYKENKNYQPNIIVEEHGRQSSYDEVKLKELPDDGYFYLKNFHNGLQIAKKCQRLINAEVKKPHLSIPKIDKVK